MVVSVPRVFARLKSETQAEHTALEQRLALAEQPLTLERYVRILATFYGFYIPWMSQLDSWIGMLFPDPARRRGKGEALTSDLWHFGVDPRTLPLFDQSRPFQSLGAAAGSLYVMEGATLGGQIIARKVRQDLQLENDAGCLFFSGYGQQTGALWREFQHLVSERIAIEDEDEIVQSAAQTFVSFRRWIEGAGL